MLDQENCWDVVTRRDPAHDGEFFVGVLTTGIFCRPSCPARRRCEERPVLSGCRGGGARWTAAVSALPSFGRG